MIKTAQTYHLKDLVRMSQQYHSESPYAGLLEFDPVVSLDYLRTAAIQPTYEVVVAELDGATVGMCVAYLCDYAWCDQLFANIEFIYLLPEARGRGLTANLIQHQIDWATRCGAREIQAGDLGFDPDGFQQLMAHSGFAGSGVVVRKML